MGSKEKRSPDKLKSNNSAGLPRVKEGIIETPLLVAVITPPNCPVGVVFSWAVSSKNEVNATKMNKTKGFKLVYFLVG
jgi:hypothetical protein